MPHTYTYATRQVAINSNPLVRVLDHHTDFHRARTFSSHREGYAVSFASSQDLLDFGGADGAGGAGGRDRRENKDSKGPEEKIQALKNLRDITVKQGANLLLEHLEETPPLVSNAGMASRVKHFYRSKPDQPPPTVAGETLADGKLEALDPQQESPFFDDVPEGQYVSALENNMLRYPIAKHSPADTDFLVCGNRGVCTATEVSIQQGACVGNGLPTLARGAMSGVHGCRCRRRLTTHDTSVAA